ncbi:MAG: endolytic transglycosylase MltG [Candidatus Gracilibacteria bacterium]
MRHPSLKIYVIIVLIAAGILLGIKGVPAYYGTWLNTPSDASNTENFVFDIQPGDSGKTVTENLKQENLISNGFFFYWYLRHENLGNEIQSGRFVLSPSMTPMEIVNNITSGKGQMALTIPEGWTIQAIDERLVDMGLIQSGEFTTAVQDYQIYLNDTDFYVFPYPWLLQNEGSLVASFEGYLFPETYYINPSTFTCKEMITRLLDTFEAKFLSPENLEKITASGRSLNDIVIMASIVEREAFLDGDRPIIAGILWKRLDSDWALGADATLIYALEPDQSLEENLDLNSPYNTRQYKGLPPTAISNPGLASLEAALNPEASDYWFYLNDQETGQAHYGTTLEEHNQNIQEWLR